ncbi:MAG: asparagine synthase (glutamine-hydrolyzing) [Terriglobia bacterium]
MCGITGFLDPELPNSDELTHLVVSMADSLAHRGPDDSGFWVDAPAGIALGFRRLAVVDLTPAGNQPMISRGGRYVIVFNGEIYNFADLRRELEPRGHTFRGHSDTEAMLAAIEEWGVAAAMKKFIGMFAFALWDRRERALHLVRDRLGIKPLYYGWAGKVFLFGSELKAIRRHPQFAPQIDRNALALQMRYNYVPHPYSIYQKISKLPPGCMLTLSASMGEESPVPYWSAAETAGNGARDPFSGSEQEAREQLDALLRDSVRLRMIADVPLGAFLSGGIDSSTVVALMQAQSPRPVKTFTIGFEDSIHDEAAYAKAVAAHLGTDHTELRVTPQKALEVIPKLPVLFDEPFSDSSQIPTYLISALARRSVTVSLSGDGGDELFGGYPRYFVADRIWKGERWLPLAVRRTLAGVIGGRDSGTYNRWLSWSRRWFDRYGRPGQVGEKMGKLAETLRAADFRELYKCFVSHWKRPASIVLGAEEPPAIFSDAPGGAPRTGARLDRFGQMMLWDIVSYLPDDILTKVDRASMGVSLEVRLPILDHRVVEFAARLPVKLQVRAGRGKWLLRQLLFQYVPRELIERPKMGFSAPIGAWLRGELREWAEGLLSESRLQREGYFRPEPIRELWAQHLAGQRDASDSLWDVLMFQAWRKQWD